MVNFIMVWYSVICNGLEWYGNRMVWCEFSQKCLVKPPPEFFSVWQIQVKMKHPACKTAKADTNQFRVYGKL